MKLKRNPWLKHLMKFKKANPKLTLTEAMQKAKVTYKGGKK